MMAVPFTTNADYCLLYRNESGTPRYFNDQDRATEPRKRPVDHDSFQRVHARFKSGKYDGIALIKDGKVFEHLPGGEPPQQKAPAPIKPVESIEPARAVAVASSAVNAQPEPAVASSPSMVSGFGQFHTNEADPQRPNKPLRPYLGITFAQIQAMVDEPQQVEKPKAQWLIPSSMPSRDFKRQEAEGQFHVLWLDLDENPPQVDRVAELVAEITSGSDFEVYTSSRATVDRPKCRALIPLAKPLSGGDWVLCQEILNDLLASHGVVADRASQRTAQLCYLPNKERDFYQSRSQRDGVLFDPLAQWSERITKKREAIAAAEAAVAASRIEAQARRAALTATNGTAQRKVIDAFNEAFTVEELLIQAGYAQSGDTFRHPSSQSGSFSATVKNGRVHALSSRDPLFSDGQGAHDAFSTFSILMHGGNEKAAMKDAGDNWLSIGSESFNKVAQREYMQAMARIDESGVLANGAGKPNASNSVAIDSPVAEPHSRVLKSFDGVKIWEPSVAAIPHHLPMKKNLLNTALVGVVILLTGCAAGTQTSNSYTGAQTRQAQIVKTGSVTYVKDVKISNNSGVGGVGGAALGGVAGAGNGRSGSNQQAGSAIAGAIIGGIIGQLADSKLNELDGQEVGVLLANGVEIAVTQEIDPQDGRLNVGDRVRVLTAATGITRISRQ